MKTSKTLLVTLASSRRARGGAAGVNPIHPTFVPLAPDGKPARRAEDVSADATCGACHDARWIASHTGHGEGRARATCIQCHVDGGRLDLAGAATGGRLPREALRIGAPKAASCAACHGVVSDGRPRSSSPRTSRRCPAPAAPGR